MNRFFRLGPELLIDSTKVINIRARSFPHTIEVNYPNHWKQRCSLNSLRGKELSLSGYCDTNYVLKYENLEDAERDFKILKRECIDADIIDNIDE